MQYRVEDEIELIPVRTPKGTPKIEEKTIKIKQRECGPYKNLRRYRLQISADLVEGAALKPGDKVHLGKVKSASIWVLIPTEFSDGLTVRKESRASYYIDSMDLVAKLHTASGVDEFDAWADECRIYFKPKEE